MRKLFLCFLALSVAGFAFASDLEKKDLDISAGSPLSRGLLDCANAIGICCGQTLQGDNTGMPNNVINYGTSTLSENGGEVVYCFGLPTVSQQVTITLVPSGCDLDLWVLGSCDEADELAHSAGTGTEVVTFSCLDPGFYYIVVDGYGSTYPGAECPFEISIDCEDCPVVPENDTCEGAFDLCALADGGVFNESYNTILANNDYTLAYGGCTGYATDGPDVVYEICLEPGGSIDVTQTGTNDMALYLITDCADPLGSCVIGSDNCCTGVDEYFVYTSVAGGTYYLIVDAYSSTGGTGTIYGTLTGCCTSATESGSWGSVKQLFR
ncbi:MAG: hypothetical protein JW958_08225 [Candidatus Eisenbacteria bacterium]|nr:hypothetical protein [Candidatus Eisenbacteria bacterium]